MTPYQNCVLPLLNKALSCMPYTQSVWILKIENLLISAYKANGRGAHKIHVYDTELPTGNEISKHNYDIIMYMYKVYIIWVSPCCRHKKEVLCEFVIMNKMRKKVKDEVKGISKGWKYIQVLINLNKNYSKIYSSTKKWRKRRNRLGQKGKKKEKRRKEWDRNG